MEHHTIAAVCLTVILFAALIALVARFLLIRARREESSKAADEDVESQSQISEHELVILQNLFLECEHRTPIDAVAANVPPPDYTEKARTFSQACYSLSSSPPSYADAFEAQKEKKSALRAQVLTPIYDIDEHSDSSLS